MSQVLIQKYLNELNRLRQVSGTHRESVVREAFKDLLKNWGRSFDLTFIPEYELETRAKERRYVDGALLHTLRVPFGYWEAKDEKDNLDAEIEHKFKRGYPKTNIIFEDSTQAALIQHGVEVMRCGVDDVAQLEKLLTLFFAYERPEIEAFRKAVEQFKADLPAVLLALREMIECAFQQKAEFRKAAGAFLKHAQEAINPSLTEADVREMLIQHVLTGEIFAAVFPGNPFHEDNNVARELHKLEATFFSGDTRYQALKGLEPYYTAIRKAASEISTHHEKQSFLKAIYENFYKVYNKKAADRLGVVYTPNEIVRFMIDSADWLCEQHFKRNLIDRNVDILDPATGTGTFICELIAHFAGQPEKLQRKYLDELHANEVAILPYYVANLNIEATYAAAAGKYEEFPGLCFVDTLDNVTPLRKHRGHMEDLFGGVSDENIGRIKRQNSKTISVIIGNPPYNANQLNENENNKNREYPEIDKRIKETYIERSTAQKTKLYDMYARFFRWASDRLDENGVLAFISNRSFIESRTFDGFRETVAKEFDEVRIVDLGGDVRSNPKLSGTTHNVFGIQTGVAISFMVRKKNPVARGKKADEKTARIFYSRRPEMETAAEKLSFLGNTRIGEIEFEELRPDEKGSWLTVSSNDFESLIPIASKEVKAATKLGQQKAIFKTFSLGMATNRDDWAYDWTENGLASKVVFFVDHFNAEAARGSSTDADVDRSIKWTSELEALAKSGTLLDASRSKIRTALYRPFVERHYFHDEDIVHRFYKQQAFYPNGIAGNRALNFLCVSSENPLCALAADKVVDLCLLKQGNGGTFSVGQFRYEQGNRIDNITDWALEQFKKYYKLSAKERPITKEGMFHYVYGVLHNPAYREKYALNLKREFPRIPFYDDFWKWSDWGRALMDLHIGYETVEPFELQRRDVPDGRAKDAGLKPKPLLRADKDKGTIQLDSETLLSGVPATAWDYRLGNRSAIEWVLDQYKEKTPKDPTVREKFNTYRFADYKDKFIDLLARVTAVSVETMKVIDQMRSA